MICKKCATTIGVIAGMCNWCSIGGDPDVPYLRRCDAAAAARSRGFTGDDVNAEAVRATRRSADARALSSVYSVA